MTAELFDLSTLRPRTPAEAHAPAIARGAKCALCPLYGLRQGPVLGDIRPNPKLFILGEAPGTNEIQQRKPFVGQSGIELDQSLIAGGLQRTDASITNVLLCRPDKDVSIDDFMERQNRAHKKACSDAEKKDFPAPPAPMSPFEACRPRLELDMLESGVVTGYMAPDARATPWCRTVLAVGGKALRAVAQQFGVPYGHESSGRGFASISDQHGSPIQMGNGTIVCSSLHPAYAMRDKKQFTQIIRDQIARAAEITVRGTIDWSEPEYLTFPDEATIAAVCAKFIETNAQVTVDIETDDIDLERAKIRCIGLGATLKDKQGDLRELVLVVPLRWMDGRNYWPDAASRSTAEMMVREVLDRCRLVFHNGMFDTAVLLRTGLMTDRKKVFDDTMIAHHDTDSNDLPHDLGFVTRQFTSAPLWKNDVDHKVSHIREGERGVNLDKVLHTYNAKDVLATMRIWGHLDARISACATREQYVQDSALLPIAREMGRLGVWIDEKERGHLSETFNTICAQLRIEFEQAVGKPINPRSWQQVGRWLFEEKGYMPTLNTDGYQFKAEDEDDPSTSTPALMALQDLGLDPQTDKAVSVLLKFRSVDTLRSRYVDGLHVDYERADFDLPALPAVVMGDREVLPSRPELSRLFLQWKLQVIPSGRWVCDPTVQNWPSRGFVINDKPTNMRKMIVAPPGHVLVGADYEQIELRIYGVVANDKYVLKAFRDGLEPHCLNAATIMAPSEGAIQAFYEAFVGAYHLSEAMKKDPSLKTLANIEKVSKIKFIRTVAKRVAYLMNYGGEGEKLYQSMSAERDKATNQRVFPNLAKERVDEWEERWLKRHPETKVWHKAVARRIYKQGYVETLVPPRRKRYFIGGPNKKNAPPNHEIQAEAARMKNDSILRLAEAIPFGCWSPQTGLCLDIHDFLAVIVPESRADEAKSIVEKCMFQTMTCADGGIMPFPAQAVASKSLADQ